MNNKSTAGLWLPRESEHHINYPELLATLFVLQRFHSSLSGKHAKTITDNTSAVYQVNNKGTFKVRNVIPLSCRSGNSASHITYLGLQQPIVPVPPM